MGFHLLGKYNCYQNVVPRMAAATAASGDLPGVNVLRSHLRPTAPSGTGVLLSLSQATQ